MTKDIRDFLRYDPIQGEFRWQRRTAQTVKKDDVAGSIDSKGYRVIRLHGRYYKAHRLAWYLTFGRWPRDQIDHINGIRDDNRLVNLREASNKENKRNSRLQKNNTTGLKGVYPVRHGNKWKAQIMVDGMSFFLGCFLSREEAHAAYCEAAKQHYGEFARTS